MCVHVHVHVNFKIICVKKYKVLRRSTVTMLQLIITYKEGNNKLYHGQYLMNNHIFSKLYIFTHVILFIRYISFIS